MTPKELLQKGFEEQHTEELTYADDWTDESIFWAQNNVYQAAASALPRLKRDDVHIDLGCGVGFLPFFIARKNPLATVMGIERNPHMLRHTLSLHEEVQRMEGVPIPLQTYHGEVMGVRSDNKVISIYLPAEALEEYKKTGRSNCMPDDLLASMPIGIGRLEELKKYPTPDPDLNKPGVKIVIDDLTRLDLTRHYLGERKVQSFSSTFPGSSARIVTVAGVQKGDYAAVRKTFAEFAEEKSRKEMDFIAERLAPGGTLLLLTRVPADMTQDEKGRRRVAQSFQEHLGAQIDEFEPEFSGSISQRVFTNPTRGRIAWLGPSGKPGPQEARVATVLFKRK